MSALSNSVAALVVKNSNGNAEKRKRVQTTSNPIPATLESIKHYPSKLKIHKTLTSPYWQVRYPAGTLRLVRRTKTTNKTDAIAFAKSFFDEIILRQRQNLPLTVSPTFERCAEELIQYEITQTAAGDRSKEFSRFLAYSVRKRVIPFFKGSNVTDVRYQLLIQFVQTLRDDSLLITGCASWSSRSSSRTRRLSSGYTV